MVKICREAENHSTTTRALFKAILKEAMPMSP
jgi:hypothetical protein